jgi:hypothetical protein
MRLSIGAILKTLAATAAVVALTGCGGGGGGGSSVPKPTIRFTNVSPDSTSLSFLFDDDVKASGLVYLASTPTFAEVSANDYDIFVTEESTGDVLDAITSTIQADKDYVIAAVGLETYGDEFEKRVRIVGTQVDLTAPNGSKARLYVLHGFNRSVGFSTPSIDFQSPGDNPQYKLTNIGFGQVQSIVVDAGSQTFEARRNGTENVYVTSTQTLDDGGIYLVIFSGIEGAVGAQAPQMTFQKLN